LKFVVLRNLRAVRSAPGRLTDEPQKGGRKLGNVADELPGAPVVVPVVARRTPTHSYFFELETRQMTRFGD